MALELIPLCIVTATLVEPIRVSDSLQIIEVASLQVDGERIQATMKGRAAADWLDVSPDGYATVDVRGCVETADGAQIYVSYGGRVDFATGTVYVAPRFHTGAEQYAWLNKIQAVGKGTFSESGQLVYEFFELR